MAAVATTIAAIAAVVGTYQQMEAAKDAKADRQRAYDEQVKAQSEQKAMNAAQSAAAKRQAIREERVKRARIMQSATGTGVDASSAEAGSLGSMSTQLGSNLGYNIGMNNAAGRISDLNQSAAGFLSSAENHMASANQWGQVAGLGMSIFGQTGGFKTMLSNTNNAPVVTPMGQSKQYG